MTYALTVKQPWAALIMAGAKPFEFRSWKAWDRVVGQRIVIHAAALMAGQYEVDKLIEIHERTAGFNRELAEEILDRVYGGNPQLACGLGTVIVGVPVPSQTVIEGEPPPLWNWAWPMNAPELWPQPVPFQGQLSMWKWGYVKQKRAA